MGSFYCFCGKSIRLIEEASTSFIAPASEFFRASSQARGNYKGWEDLAVEDVYFCPSCGRLHKYESGRRTTYQPIDVHDSGHGSPDLSWESEEPTERSTPGQPGTRGQKRIVLGIQYEALAPITLPPAIETTGSIAEDRHYAMRLRAVEAGDVQSAACLGAAHALARIGCIVKFLPWPATPGGRTADLRIVRAAAGLPVGQCDIYVVRPDRRATFLPGAFSPTRRPTMICLDIAHRSVEWTTLGGAIDAARGPTRRTPVVVVGRRAQESHDCKERRLQTEGKV